ncbi:MAG: FkbM family methyltransferase [Synergistaceae bacterium]|nr:FkbM family methyltransferase [Synergistaceae bacterium]
MILRSLFLSENWIEGFYVDVGAYHPKRFSNTYYFYQTGWRGINIDANADAIKLFNKYRPRDINVHSGVGTIASNLKYYQFKESAYSTFSEERYKDLLKKQIAFESIREVPVFPLSEILKRYISDKQRISFMDIDVEGLDYDVLLSNDWEIYRPVYLLVEIWNTGKKDIDSSKESLFLREKGYRLVAKANNTSIFRAV